MNKKIIFLDIDGTLTAPGTNIPPDSAIEAIGRARKGGHKIFLCTGRNYDMLRPLLDYEFDGFIASSGGYVKCNDEVVFDCPMTEEQKASALEVLKENGIFRTVECLNDSYTDEGFAEFVKVKGDENSELIRWRKQIEEALNIKPMNLYANEPVYKIVFMCKNKEQIEKAERVLGEDFNIVIQSENEYGLINGELVNKKFDKGEAVKKVYGYYKMKRGDTIGIGDSANDIGMFKAVGKAVCVKNGSEELLALADMVCPSYDEDGIFEAFKQLELI